MKKVADRLFNSRAAGVYILIFAAAIGVATFIENDFGTSSAQHVVFQAWWFTLLLTLFCLSLIYNIWKFRMIPQKKWAILTFHLAMIVILLGAGVTRYFGYEGIMHIREGEQSNSFLSADTYLEFHAETQGQWYSFDEKVLFSTLGNNNWEKGYKLGDRLITVRVEDFIPNPAERMEIDEVNGKPTLKVVFGGANGRIENYIAQGEHRTIQGMDFNFTDEVIPGAFNIQYQNDTLKYEYFAPIIQTVMATQTTDTIYPEYGQQELQLRALYNNGLTQFVFGDFQPSARVNIVSTDRKVKNESVVGLLVSVNEGDVSKSAYVFGRKGAPGRPSVIELDGMRLNVLYGAKQMEVPFSIHLYDFIMERYPGTNSATSYASEVQLRDTLRGEIQDYRIFMNNILTYDGYRFFQSSFDKDEKGTYLSVNHDFWGTWISYFGYALLTLGMVLTLFSKKSRFRDLATKIKRMRANRAATILLLCLGSLSTFAQADSLSLPVVSVEHAEKFSRLIVQDVNGRMKPMHTLSREVLRKVTRSEKFGEYTPDQVMLSMFVSPVEWHEVPMIKLGKHDKVKELIGVTGDKASFLDFFDRQTGAYVLYDEVERAEGMAPIDRGVYEKELQKVNERVNVMNLVTQGYIFRIVPLVNDSNNTWIAGHAGHRAEEVNEMTIANEFFTMYPATVRDAILKGDYELSDQLLDGLMTYQRQIGAVVMPSDAQIDAEIALNNLNVFNRLAAFYAILGMIFLLLLFYSVFRPNANMKLVVKILVGLLIIGFIGHTVGLGLRWYVSGRAPWSNGYESMIYIAWTTVLAGILFARKALGGLAATMVLAATVLLVAMLSYLDPEITPLVPVLRSYWLTIHVSLIAGSYGFLMLGAVIGLINLILMIMLTKKNEKRIRDILKEMTYMSEMTLIGGLFMISVGTYLGGVWANESWGRYWGWDAKETWALVTILVYAFILHMRLIPKLNGLFSFNFATIFGLASVIMTYFGVNYYLSGLHSYAAGDPVPIPTWVYFAVAAVALISTVAYIRKRNFTLIR